MIHDSVWYIKNCFCNKLLPIHRSHLPSASSLLCNNHPHPLPLDLITELDSLHRAGRSEPQSSSDRLNALRWTVGEPLLVRLSGRNTLGMFDILRHLVQTDLLGNSLSSFSVFLS